MMTALRKILRMFGADERGATAIEYGLLAAGISLAIIAIVGATGEALNDSFYTKIGEGLSQ